MWEVVNMAGLWRRPCGWFLVLLGVCIPFYTAEILSEVDVVLEDPRLVCGEEGLQYWIPDVLHDGQTLRVSIQDKYGKLQSLKNDSTCGLWLYSEYDGSLELLADYYGCYIMTLDMDYVMTLHLEHLVKGRWETYSTEELKCAMTEENFVMDAPNPSVCAAVKNVNRLPCATPSTSQDDCQQLGCCYDQTNRNIPCYYGNQITALCTMDGQLSVAVSKDVTSPPLILSSVGFPGGSGAGCGPVNQNDAFVLFWFPLTDCGTTRKVDGNNVVYENEMVADKDIRAWLGASITRDSTFRLHISCSFTASGSIPLMVQVFTLPPPSPASSSGSLTLEMRIAKDVTYSQYYGVGEYPIVKVLRDPVYVEVRILQRSDPALNLVLEQCWASTSMNPLLQPQWPILEKSCPFTGDNYQTLIEPVASSASLAFPSYYERFVIHTFTFVDSPSHQALGGLVYLHCSASVCTPPWDSCVPPCGSSRKKRSENRGSNLNEVSLVTSKGPVDFHMDNTGMIIIEESQDISNGLLQWIRIGAAILGVATIALVCSFLWSRRIKEPKSIDSNVKA